MKRIEKKLNGIRDKGTPYAMKNVQLLLVRTSMRWFLREYLKTRGEKGQIDRRCLEEICS